MKKNIIALHVVVVLFSFLSCFSQGYLEFNKILQDRGLAHSDVHSIIQDDHGFIWFGTLGGLNRFDGYELKTFSNQNNLFESVYKNRIEKIIQQKNFLWLVTQGGIECFDLGKEKYLDLQWKLNDNASLQNAKLLSVYVSPNNILYVLSESYLKAFEITYKESRDIVLQELFLDNEPKQAIYVDMQADEKGLQWVVTNKGLFLLIEERGKIQIKPISVESKNKIYKNFSGLFAYENNYLLLGTQNGFLKANTSIFDTENQSKVSASFYEINYPYINSENIVDNSLIVNSFEKSVDNSYWIGSSYGLIKAELVNTAYNFTFYNEKNSNLSSSSIVALLKDESGCLWLSNYDGGINFVDLNKKGFKSIVYNANSENSISENYIRAIAEDKLGNIWIGTEKTGLNYYNFKDRSVKKFKHSKKNSKGISSNKIRSLIIDNDGRLWVGTAEGINIYSEKTNSFYKISDVGDSNKSLSNKIIFALAEDKFGNIWAGSWLNGLNRINYKDEKDFEIEHVYKKNGEGYGLSSNVITFIYADSYYPEVFVGTNNGLNHIFLNEDGSINEILHYKGSESYTQSISSNWVWPIVRENDSTLWVGTLGGGLNKLMLDSNLELGYKAKSFSIKEGAPSTDIETIIYDDDKGELWLGGKGLSRFNIEREEFTNYDKEDGLVGNSFKVGAAFKGESGRFYFGSTKGISYFYPSQIETNTFNSNVVFTNLYVNNQIIDISETSSEYDILPITLNSTDEIELNHFENNFQIQFSSLHYANPNRSQFKYRLLNYNDDWIVTNASDRKASYSNLPYGEYLFEVMATNNDGVWSSDVKRLAINIIAPWWLTNFARICYVVLGILILILSYYLLVRWFGLKKAYEVSVIKEQEKEKMYQFTGQFFTNISHEFKTPLTLILNPLEKLMKEDMGGSYKKEKYYQLMYKNAKRLLRLINELIDYRKVSSNAYKLNSGWHYLNPFFDDIKDSFKSALESKSITFNYKNNLSYEKLNFDKIVLEKIIFNLLGNAIKFSNNGGKIDIRLSEEREGNAGKYLYSNSIKSDFVAPSYTYISIEDTASGIDEVSISKIFERFFQAGNTANIQGSGIGLTLVKSLVEIHKMNLSVYSKEEVGTKFVLEIPNVDFEKEFGDSIIKNTIQLSKNALSPFVPKDDIIIDNKVELFETYTKPEILLVEDNAELRSFIKDDFDSEFSVFEASNGKEALEILEEHRHIKVIVSDIMMPVMGGVELCKVVKSHSEFSNIPFILLSAKYNTESQIEGAQSGADIYLSKPFSLEVLHLTILNVLKSRKQIKQAAIENTFEEARKNVKGNTEDEFLKKVINCIDDNIDDVNFDVVKLCKLLGISKTKLYTKIKEVTSESVGGLIRSIRLKKAAQILSSTDLNIIQVMDKVGMQSQSHFTKSFKKQFGVTPSEFVKNLNTTKKQ